VCYDYFLVLLQQQGHQPVIKGESVKLQTLGAWCRNVACSVCQHYICMNICKDMRFWVLTTVSVNIMVFWDVASVVW